MGDEAIDEEDEERPSAPAVVPRVRARKLLEREWDAIVVGAGVGGLAAAVLLATRAGLRVLVLERHYEPGGLTQTFRRRHDEFEVGVHYVGQVGQRTSSLRRMFDVLTEGRLGWSSFGPVHDRVFFEDREIQFGSDPDRTRDELVRFAPTEERAIDQYLAEVRACARAAPRHLLARAELGALVESRQAPFWRFVDATTSEHLRAIGASDRLAAALTYSYRNYGCPPERSSFAAHAIAVDYYMRGASYPVGGGSRIAAEMITTLVRRGGAVIVRAGVDAIRVRDGRVEGVRLEDGRELSAPIVISDAGLSTTCHRLLDENDPGVGEMREAAKVIGPSYAHCGLYLGLRGEPAELGLEKANQWRLGAETEPVEKSMAAWLHGERAEPSQLFISTSCASDPTWTARRPGRSSVVALFGAQWSLFEAFEHTERGRRGPDYDTLKARLTRGALAAVSRAMPSIVDAIDHVELSTPLTTRSFSRHARGEIAGLDHTPAHFHLASTPRTAIAGLALAGQDAWLAGIGGAIFGGVSAASHLLRRDLAREVLARS